MPIVVAKKPPFAPKKVAKVVSFELGLNTKTSSLLLDDKEVQDIQNFHFDERGALTKRKGYLKHYAATFNSSPARDAYNYRKQNGTSRLVLAAADKLYSDNPQFVRLYDLEADWETIGVQTSGVSTTTAGDIVLTPQGMLGQFLLGAASALLGGPFGITRSGTWQSEVINISAVTNLTSGVVALTQTVPAATTITVKTRTSADGATGWSAYAGLGVGNTIVSPANNYLQVQVTMTSTTYDNPSVQSLQVTFDTTATATVLASGLSTFARYTFATQNDILYITNGVNVMSKWDGTTYTTPSPGTPPTAKYVFVHKNIMFLAGNATNPSRVYFSGIGDPETWPALNFIDVGKGDGDQITGLAVLLDRLVIFKGNSTWLLEGDSSSNFILRRVTDTAGCVDQHSIVVVKNTLGFLARDGYYFFDGLRAVLASEKIQPTVSALNSSQFGLVSAVYYPSIRKVFISLPGAGMTSNDTVLVFDALRTAWTVYKGIPAASFVIWRQFNKDNLLFGDSTTGQLYDMETGYSDNGAAIVSYATTKGFDLGGSEIEKIATSAYLDSKETSGTGNATASMSFFKDLSTTESTAISFTITGTQMNVKRGIPSSVGVSSVRDLAIKIAHTSATTSITVYGISLEHQPKIGLRAT